MEVAVERLSGYIDRIPLVMSACLRDPLMDYPGYMVQATGQYRSYNRNKHTEQFVFVRDLQILDMAFPLGKGNDNNKVVLDGYICKQPIYRRTPLGRKLAEMLVAVNRQFGRSDYIPCICWGTNAMRAAALAVGSHVLLEGRIQSREYQKRTEGYGMELRTAYEVSVGKLEYLAGTHRIREA